MSAVGMCLFTASMKDSAAYANRRADDAAGAIQVPVTVFSLEKCRGGGCHLVSC